MRLWTKSQVYITEGKYELAIDIFEKIEKKAINKPHYAYESLQYAYKLKNFTLFYQSLNRLINYDHSQYELVSRNNFSYFKNWTDSLDTYYHQSIIIRNVKSLSDSSSLGLLLIHMHDREVVYRGRIGKLYKQFNDGEISRDYYRNLTDSLFKLQKPVDLINQNILDSLIEEFQGLPNLLLLNQQQFHTIFIIIQHSHGKKRKYYEKLYKKEMKDFNVPIIYYPQIVDRTRQFLKKKSSYGFIPNEKLNEGHFVKLHYHRINKNRILIGQPPIKK